MTWNIRRRARFPWLRKKQLVDGAQLRAALLAERPTVLGGQEALADRRPGSEWLGQAYRFVGHGRRGNGGEGNRMLFDSLRLELLGWHRRRCPSAVEARLRDHGAPSIRESWCQRASVTGSPSDSWSSTPTLTTCSSIANQFRAQAVGRLISTDLPVIVTGDFNATADSEPMWLLLEQNRLVET